MIHWPTSLPDLPDRDGYAEDWAVTTQEQEVSTGHTLTRPRFSFSPDEFSVPISMSGDQVETFRAFYRDDLKGGAKAFEYVWPRTNVAGSYKIRGSVSVRNRGGDLWRVEFTLRRVA